MMSKVFVLTTLLLETIMVLACVHTVFGQRMKGDKHTVTFIVLVSLVYLVINEGILSHKFSILVYILIIIYCYRSFKLTFFATVLRVVAAFIMAGAIEAVVAFGVIPLQNTMDSTMLALTASVAAMGVAVGIKYCANMPRRFKEGKPIAGLLGGATVFGVLIIDYYINKSQINISSILILVFMSILYIYIYRLEQKKKEIEKKNLELELQRVYGGVYEQLLNEVRIHQHDFKNQLSAVYSMHTVARSLEELVAMQREYGDQIVKECRFDSILTSCNNPVLAGYLYYSCIACEKEKIDVTYKISLDRVESAFSIHEIIEILGIFFQNACENMVMNPGLPQKLKLDFSENEDAILFSFSNPVSDTASETGRLFRQGYSTKGENRGIGLPRAKELAARHASEIKVFRNREEGVYWIHFTICIQK